MKDFAKTVLVLAVFGAIVGSAAAAPPTYTLTVVNGSGDGTYRKNVTVAISADAPSQGQQFDQWAGDTPRVADIYASDTTIRMPGADTTVTATYTNITYTLTVNSGTGDGNYEMDTVVGIVADAPGAGQIFDLWTGDTTNIDDVNEANTTITMPAANTEITATYVNVYDLIVNSGTGDGTYEASTVVGIVADAPGGGQQFDVWTGDTSGIDNVNAANTTITMPASATEITATYTGGLPAPWENADIGNPPIAGSAEYADGNWTIEASGSIWGQADSFHFVYQPYSGDVEIIANVTSVVSADNPWAAGGVMIRQTLNANAKSAFMAVSDTIAGGIIYDYRTEVDGNTTETYVAGEEPEWVKLRREGSVIKGYRSNDGSSWTLVDTITFNMDPNVQIGLAVAENDDSNTCITVLRDVSVVPLYTLTVNSGAGDGYYAENDVAGIVADAPGGGQQFDVWTGDTAGIADVNEANTTITMPASNAEITATYTSALYTLTVNSGTGDGDYALDTVVGIVADAPGAGEIFDVWTGDTTNIDDVNEANTTITMPAAATEITATYVNVYTLTVNSGSGDGDYEASTVVGIVADAPGVGKLFDVWTGDTGNIDDVNEANTTITIPAAATEITATYEDDPNYEPPGGGERGYTSRACGFDMDDDGNIGGAGDDDVGDGVTTDPDGDGTDEDILYVDATDGNDTTGDGSPGNPYKTIQYALDQADGPGDGAEDIICIAGTFEETLTIADSGVAGYYVRDNFQFPNNPLMLIGWDADNDGEYPPYDTDDTAVLDGNMDGNALALAVTVSGKQSYLEIAHLTIKKYGYKSTNSGAFQLFPGGSGEQTHIYVHDVELYDINKAHPDGSSVIVLSWWGGPRSHVAIINNLVDDFASYFCRGSPQNCGNWRFQNLTLNMYGNVDTWTTGWKLWGVNNYTEIIDCVIDAQASEWNPNGEVSGIGVCQGTQDWTIRNNLIIDAGITLQPFASGYYQGRRLDDILIDRNIFASTYDGWDMGGPTGVNIQGYVDANEEESVQDATITNNFFYTSRPGWRGGIDSGAGNGTGPQIGTITIAGNTICGPFTYDDIYGTKNASGITIVPNASLPYMQQDYVIKNNIIGEAISTDKNIQVSYAPTGWVANGNVYDPDARFRWDETQHWVTISFSEWRTQTGQDANSTLGEPLFVDDANYDYHLDPNDTVAQGKGVDISGITDHDYDGDTRDSSTKTAGADVP